jgi:hypothetical protein
VRQGSKTGSCATVIPNWSQLRKTPISFRPSRRMRTSFSVGR